MTVPNYDSLGTATRMDTLAANTGIATLKNPNVDVHTIYFAGPDNVAHALPDTNTFDCTLVPRVRTHFQTVTDRQFGRFLDRLEANGLLHACAFALVADHGMIRVHNDDRHNIKIQDNKVELETLVITDTTHGGMGLDPLWRGDNIGGAHAVYSPNGGIGMVYIRSGTNAWGQAPSYSDVRAAAVALYREATGAQNIVPDLNGALGPAPNPAIFVRMDRDTGSCAFNLPFMWMKGVLSDGRPDLVTIAEFLATRGLSEAWPHFEDRLEELNDRQDGRCGDIIIVMDAANGFLTVLNRDGWPGWHGGPTRGESEVPLLFNFLGADKTFIEGAVNAAKYNHTWLRTYDLTTVVKNIVTSVRGGN